jgi:hypothetical protein
MTDPIKLAMLINGHSPPSSGTSNSTVNAETNTKSSDGDPNTNISSNTDANLGESISPSLSSSVRVNIEEKKPKTRGRKRTLKGPPYICQYPGCDKSFQRSEHLSRHKLNHNPKTIFNCEHPGCDKTFVRHDLLVRHLKRHEIKLEKQKQSHKSNEFLSNVVADNDTNADSLRRRKRSRVNEDPTTSTSATEIVQLHQSKDNTPSDALHTTGENARKSTASDNSSNFNNGILPSNNAGGGHNLLSWLFTDPGVMSNSIVPPPNAENYFNEAELSPMSNSRFYPSTASNLASTTNNSTNNMSYNYASQPQLQPNRVNLPDTAATSATPGASTVSAPIPGMAADGNFLSDLSDFHMNNNTQNFFIVQDDFSPSSSSSYFSPTDQNQHQHQHQRSDPSNNLRKISSNTNLKDKGLKSFQQSQGKQVNEALAYQFDEGMLYTLTNEQMTEFGTLIPVLKGNVDFTKLKFEKALKTYWNFFHPRFPMLHRPTFNSTDAPSLLLLAMIVLGSKLYMCVDNITCPDERRLKNPKSLSDTITEPLRWLLFASPFFQPPAEVWIIQSLLMLEFYEKHCTTRRLHERSHLHHGTTIQLLRRSPTLGGASTKINNDSSAGEAELTDNWYKWIEIESMKRATFMCFYMDATDAICMGHQMFIYSHQIQMTMPVEDSVWESNFNQFTKNFKSAARPKPFLIVLRNMMNGQATRTNSFGKKILLAGLSAILFQIQQRDLQLFFGLDKFTNTISKNWRDLLTAAFAIWRNDVGASCCSSKTAIDNLNSLGNSSQFSTSDTRCKCISYHLAHIYMSISHYDIFIVAGAPWRMNVKPSSAFERNCIKNRVVEWTKTRHCEISVVQCYLSLFEMFLSPQDSTYEYQYNYLPDADLFFRSYSIGYMLLVLWSYLFVKGRFQNIDLNHENNQNGYLYLKHIRCELTTKSDIQLHTWRTTRSGADFYGDLMRWVNVLNEVDGLENIIGLLNLVGNKLVNADYLVVKEVGKLLLFCRDRTTGATDKNILEDMYLSR